MKVGYVGVEACRECHRQRVEAFTATSHFRTSRLPQPDELSGLLDEGTAHYQTRDPRLSFQVERRGAEVFETAIRQTDAGQQRRSERIGLVYGAGSADEVFHYWRQNELFELPLAYLHPLEQWGNAPGFMDGTANFSRPTSPRCLECHTTFFEHAPGTANAYNRQNFVLGVTCERCHGEGGRHVQYHQTHPDEAEARFIVHPGGLARDRQLDVCSQCHSNANARRTAPFSYRPGEPLESFFRIDKNSQPEHDHTANQIRYLRESRCFQGDDALTCTTCHNPHAPAGPRNAASVERSCFPCHQAEHCGQRSALPAEVQVRCLDCHMPNRPVINITFDTATDEYVSLIRRHEHRIAVYPDATKQTLLNWLRTQTDSTSQTEAERLAGELIEQHLADAEKYQQEYRYLPAIGAYREALNVQADPATEQKLSEVVNLQRQIDLGMQQAQEEIDAQAFAKAIATLREILRLKPDHALAHGKLGMLLANEGQTDAAIDHLQAVGRLDPDSAYGDALLGWIFYLRHEPAQAIPYYVAAIEKEPYDAKLHFHLGLAKIELKKLDEAAEQFRKALEIEPRHIEACQHLSLTLRELGQFDEAIRYGELAASMTRYGDPVVLTTLAEVYADAGRLHDAIATAQEALRLAQVSSPQIIPQIRERLDEFQRRANQP